jgi:hypothetical protein
MSLVPLQPPRHLPDGAASAESPCRKACGMAVVSAAVVQPAATFGVWATAKRWTRLLDGLHGESPGPCVATAAPQ